MPSVGVDHAFMLGLETDEKSSKRKPTAPDSDPSNLALSSMRL
jgi:hypothetical protein